MKKTFKTTNKSIERAYSEKFINALIEATKKDPKSWSNPCIFGGLIGGAYNATTKYCYRKTNLLFLGLKKTIKEYQRSAWLTFKQVNDLAKKTSLNIHVRKGEESTPIIFWKKLEKSFIVKKDDEELTDEEPTDEELEEQEKEEFETVNKTIWMLRQYFVFNVEQIEWNGWDYVKELKLKDESRMEDDKSTLSTMESARKFLTKNYKNGAPQILELAITTNCYSPMLDVVEMCVSVSFRDTDIYFATLAHELAHSTGANGRLNRIKTSARFGSKSYAVEELVAEISAQMLCEIVGIRSTYENTVAYLQSWTKNLREIDNSCLYAFTNACKAVDWILGR